MKKIKFILVSLVLFTVFFEFGVQQIIFANISHSQILIRRDDKSTNRKNEGKYIVKLKEGLSDQVKKEYLRNHALVEEKVGKENIVLNRVLTSNIDSLTDSGFIEVIEEDGVIEAQSVEVNDPRYEDQWYLKAISYESTLEEKMSTNEVTVAVIDTGVCHDHPDLKGRILEGWNFVDNNLDVTDQHGHGCAVSGVIAANTNNKVGLAGASLITKIMPLKVIGADGTGNYSVLMNAIDYAVSKDVDIINISLGGYFDSVLLHEVIQNAEVSGVKVIASSGNTGNNEIMFPAQYQEVLSVGSVENDYTVSPFSSSSENIDLWAYGSHILTTSNDGSYSEVNGTSIASALVSAFVANNGNYKHGRIISYVTTDINPITQNDPVEVSEPISGLKFTAPSGLNIEGFENENPQGFVINWQRVIKIASGETMIVSVWNRNSQKIVRDVYATILEQDGCKKSINGENCLVSSSPNKGELSNFNKYILKRSSLIRVVYTINNGVGFNIFSGISSQITLANKKIFTSNDYGIIEKHIDKSKVYPQGDDWCNGIYDQGNTMSCCSSSWTPTGDYNNANCTWYAMYKRPDLRGKVWGNAGYWYTAAGQSGLTRSDSPSTGAIVVWSYSQTPDSSTSGHVAYIENVNYSSSQMTWSEQNCLTYWIGSGGTKNYGVNAYNASVTREYPTNYGGTYLLGYIPLQSANCSGTNPVLSNWIVSSSLTCTPGGSLTIQPESSLIATGNNTITIVPN